MNRINIEFVPHGECRNASVDDYWIDKNGAWQVRISKTGDDTHDMLILIHALFEFYATQKKGIREEAITAFDAEFERNRKAGDCSEPGFDPKAPYFIEHCQATALERVAAGFLGVLWKDYEKALEGLVPMAPEGGLR